MTFFRLDKRQKKNIEGSLLQGVKLPEKVHVAAETLQQPRELPPVPVVHEHNPLTFEEPPNLEGQTMLCQCIAAPVRTTTR